MTLTEYKLIEQEISRKASQLTYRRKNGLADGKLGKELTALRKKRDKALEDAEKQVKN